MKNNKNGITLITLSVTLVVIIIIISTIVVSGLYSLENAEKTSFGVEIKNIQEASDDYRLSKDEDVPSIKTFNLSTASICADIKEKQFKDELITSDQLMLEVIDLPKIGIKDTKYGNGDNELDYYAISRETNKVYYLSGIKAGGKVFYTLTSELNQILFKKENASNINKSILFIPNMPKNKWTNKALTVIVKVPEEFTVQSITATEDVQVSDVITVDGYNVYNVNTSNLVKKYIINLSYRVPDNTNTKTAIYKIEKIDSKVPSLQTSTQRYNVDSTTKIITAYITGIKTDSSDDYQSPIKSLKYIKGTIDASVDLEKFFEEHGIDVKDEVIKIDEGATSYSIYAQDEAGNYVCKNILIEEDIQEMLLYGLT